MRNNHIKKTTRYDDFTRIKGNRVVGKSHLARLRNSISHKNLLHLNPIIVNENMEVIDGQHRLSACELLEIPVYYIVGKGLTFDDVVYMNSNVKDWGITDYLESYCELGYKDYITLKKFAKKWNFSVSNSLAILSMGNIVTRAGYREFKDGQFEIKDIDHATEFAQRLRDITPYTTMNTWKDRDFIRALSIAYTREVEHDVLMERIQESPNPLHRRANITEYLRQFEDVYNYNRAKTIRLY